MRPAADGRILTFERVLKARISINPADRTSVREVVYFLWNLKVYVILLKQFFCFNSFLSSILSNNLSPPCCVWRSRTMTVCSTEYRPRRPWTNDSNRAHLSHAKIADPAQGSRISTRCLFRCNKALPFWLLIGHHVYFNFYIPRTNIFDCCIWYVVFETHAMSLWMLSSGQVHGYYIFRTSGPDPLDWSNLMGEVVQFCGDGPHNVVMAQFQPSGPFWLSMIKFNFQHCTAYLR